ncbi:ComF family protein [Rhodococcus jostii]|uniref:Predicted amidophosphoribosyltransferases n=1 Tax=Rhodococcus jostii TaxID=132919 RepID=A0A1H5JG14_RHOJO|nr:ComF family protein [Rhodococcus jostii]SEE51370.1 Predicted amidophosphoribosyltransferases [Rhodococcus jostii]
MPALPGLRSLLDLILPAECGGCGVPGTQWCARCAAELADDPVLLRPRVDPGVDVWALGPYSGPRRRAVIAAKERGRRDLAVPLGAAVAGAVSRLQQWGELDPPDLAPVVLVPAPTRPRAARARGGDPVTRIAVAAVGARRVCPALVMRRGVRDSVGLSADQRRVNLEGGVRLTRSGAGFARHLASESAAPQRTSVVLVDDVSTTGATAAESVRVLSRVGIRVGAVVVVAGVG